MHLAENPEGAESWHVPPSAQTADDPLLGCLVILSRTQGKPVAADTLTAGLPLVEHRLTPALFIRAAERAGLSAQIVKRPLDAISDLVLPAVLLLRDKQACVLVAKGASGIARIILPESGAGEREIALEELQQRYIGYTLFARPAHNFDARTAHSAVPRMDHWFWGVVTKAWPIYSEVLVASLMINLFALVMPLFTMNVYDRVVPNRAVETLWALAIGVMLVVGFDFVIRGLRSYFLDAAGKRIDIVLSSNIFEKVLGIRMAARPASVGAFASSLQEFEAFREFLTSATVAALVDLPFVIVFVIATFWIGGPLGWIAVLALPFVIGVSLALQGPLVKHVQSSYRYASQRQATLVETLVGLETIKVMGTEGPLQRKWEQVIGRLGGLSMKSRLLSIAMVNVSSFAQQAANIVVVFGVYLIAEDKLTTGGLIACTILTGRALGPLAQVTALITRFHQSRTALQSIDRLMNLPVERPAETNFVNRPRLSGGIEFRNVSFNYPGHAVAALKDVSFKIAPGERVALIGRIGSGKTTIEKLVLGLYQPDSGSVLLDGIESRQMDPAAYRRDIGHVPQDIVLFYGSVRDNIVVGAPHADDAAVLRAAHMGGVTEFVDRHPHGYKLPVGERGEGLSGGQRQAIAIARAELQMPPILLLDEPSSAMDNRSEEQLIARLKSGLRNRTLLLITHRASLLNLVTRLIVLDQGRVIADGPKEQVLAALAGGQVRVATR